MATDLALPAWTMVPFPALVLAMAALPTAWPRAWERPRVQALVTAACAVPVLAYFLVTGRAATMGHALSSYLSFVVTVGALYVASSGVLLEGDLRATPRVNALFLLVGAVLASAIGTTGASILLIRPLLRTNRQRAHVAHLVPFFILTVANAGGLLTPLGDPPLLVGYIAGVPFFWTLRLFPIWLLYVGSFVLSFYVVDRRAYARESPAALARDRAEEVPLSLKGRRNLALLLAVLPAALLPWGLREVALVALAALSFAVTPRGIHTSNRFSFAPVVEVATLFAGLFVTLCPFEAWLDQRAPSLPLREAWHLFWGAGALSAVLDNAPTYTAFLALARGLSAGHDGLVAGVSPIKLAAVSAGSVVMGATTYIGNGPNLIVKAIASEARFPVPSFARYAAFAFLAMLPAHVVTTLAFVALER